MYISSIILLSLSNTASFSLYNLTCHHGLSFLLQCQIIFKMKSVTEYKRQREEVIIIMKFESNVLVKKKIYFKN